MRRESQRRGRVRKAWGDLLLAGIAVAFGVGIAGGVVGFALPVAVVGFVVLRVLPDPGLVLVYGFVGAVGSYLAPGFWVRAPGTAPARLAGTVGQPTRHGLRWSPVSCAGEGLGEVGEFFGFQWRPGRRLWMS